MKVQHKIDMLRYRESKKKGTKNKDMDRSETLEGLNF